MDDLETLFEWEALEYKDRELKPDWFWALAIIAIAGSVAAFIFGNFLFGVFILLASIALIFFSTMKPKTQKYRVTTAGIVSQNVLYPFERLHGFWLDERDPEEMKLLLKSEKVLVPILVIPYNNTDEGDAIFDILSEVLDEKPMQEPMSHQVMERLGF